MIKIEKFSKKRFLIASIIPRSLSKQEAFYDLKELRDLVGSYGGVVVDYALQHREIHDKGLYLGNGKIEEIASLVKEKSVDIVVLNAIVKPGHIFDIKNQLEKVNSQIKVWDRVDLILHIFSHHANTTESRLQIELAAMRHMGPRIYGLGYVLSRQGGNIGTRGIGETNTELMKRHWRTQIKKTEAKLLKQIHMREVQIKRRTKMEIQTASIIGYTNAGKTSLFNLLTKKNHLAKNVLFATLDSHVGKLYLDNSSSKILISDTIGFIDNLPAKLIDAFYSSLMESIISDLLIQVVDISNPNLYKKIRVVEEVLVQLKLLNKPRLMVFNKADLVSKEELQKIRDDFSNYNPIFISTKNRVGLNELLSAINLNLTKT